MPDATKNLIFESAPLNAFLSPFSDQLPASLYSSITILGKKNTVGCIPCAVLDLNTVELQEFIIQLAENAVLDSFQSALNQETDPKYSNTLPTPPPANPDTPSQTPPPAPPDPVGPVDPAVPEPSPTPTPIPDTP